MAKAKALLPHGELESPVDGLWMVKGMAPIPLHRRMTVWKLPDGTLLVHSPIAMSDAGMTALDALGRISILLVPHTGHRLDIAFYKQRYPQARVVAPAAARAKVEEVIPVEALAEEALPPLGIVVHPMPGWKHGELGYQISLPGGGHALVLADILVNADPPPGFGAWFMSKTTGGVKGRLGVPRIMKFMMLKDRAAAKAGIARLAEIPDLRFISIAHGRAISQDCVAAIREGAASL